MSAYFGGARGKRRKFQDNLNLVPFVDLFSTMIIFLLSVAVWDQLAAVPMSVASSSQGARAIETPQDKKVRGDLKATIGKDFVELFDRGQIKRLVIDGRVFNPTELISFVENARKAFPEKSDVVIEATDGARYEHLIQVMDAFLAQEFSELVVLGNNERL